LETAALVVVPLLRAQQQELQLQDKVALVTMQALLVHLLTAAAVAVVKLLLAQRELLQKVEMAAQAVHRLFQVEQLLVLVNYLADHIILQAVAVVESKAAQ
jgi:hypothetical protein